MSRPLIACAHGTHDSAGRAAIDALVQAMRRLAPEVPIEVAYVNVQAPTPEDVVRANAAGEPPVLVPLLLTPGYHVNVDLTRAARLREGAVVAGPLAAAPEIVALFTRRLHDGIGGSDTDSGSVIVLAAAGSSDERARQVVDDCAARLSDALGEPVRTAYASASEPRIDDEVARAHAQAARVVVASYVLAPGHFADRIAAAGADVTTAPLLADEAGVVAIARVALRHYRQAMDSR